MESDIIEEDVDDIFFPPAKPVRAASRPARAGRRAAMPSDEQESEAGGDQPTSYGIGMTHQNNANSQAEEGTADKVSGSGYSASTFAYNPSNRRRRTFLLGGLINKDPENEDDGKENFVDNSDSNFASDKQEKQPTSSSTSPQLREEAKQAYPQDRAYSSSHQQQGPAPSRFPEAEIQTSSLIGRHTNNAVAQPAQVAAPASETTRPNVQNASAGEAKHSLGSNGTMIGVGLNSMASASSMPAKGGFKFRFGGKSVVPSAGAGMGAISEEKSQQDSANLQVDANFLEGNRQITSSPTAGGPSVRSSHQSQHSFAPSRSEESSVSPETSKPRQKRDGDVRSFKSDRLRLLEEELNALEVTQKLSNAYVDDRGQDLKSKQRKMNEPRSAEIDVQAKVDTGLRHGNDSESIKAELLKAYKQAEEYRRQCERYKTQLDQFTNAYDEIARLKNLVAEKVKVISILEKERSSLNKVHRQYQKEYKGQESLEAEHAERMRRLNEELRISKAKVAKYKEIHSELESQLSRAEEKVRDFDQKNRQLREKLRAVTGSDKLSFDPIKMKAQLEDKDALIKKLEHDNLVLKRVAESSEKKLKAKSKEQALGHQDLREHCKFLEDEIENKNRELRENQVKLPANES